MTRQVWENPRRSAEEREEKKNKKGTIKTLSARGQSAKKLSNIKFQELPPCVTGRTQGVEGTELHHLQPT